MLKLEEIIGNENIYDIVECSIIGNQNQLETIINNISLNIPNIQGTVLKRITSSESSVMKKLTFLVLIVTIVILLLTTICVSTTMVAVVSERKKEIALKKAIRCFSKKYNNGILRREYCSWGFWRIIWFISRIPFCSDNFG